MSTRLLAAPNALHSTRQPTNTQAHESINAASVSSLFSTGPCGEELDSGCGSMAPKSTINCYCREKAESLNYTLHSNGWSLPNYKPGQRNLTAGSQLLSIENKELYMLS